MPLSTLRWIVSRYPGWIILGWFAVALTLGLLAPDLTRLAEEGQAHLLPEDSESARADKVVREAWPDHWFQSLAVVALLRPGGLNDGDRDYARRLEEAFTTPSTTPEALLRLLGPSSRPEIAERLTSPDQTTTSLILEFETAFVAPATGRDVTLFQKIQSELKPPDGLQVLWTGDAVLGRDYMGQVRVSLDRAALVTVGLLLIVLLIVYRSLLLALIPLVTIGAGVVVSRSALAWLVQAGWEVSPLVELFLIVILFGCGTDFCLFISWRFGEHWNPANPAGAMRVTLSKAVEPLLTSAGTVIAGLSLMRVTRFKLFNSTGPSVALGLALTMLACLTLTPALLVLLARWRPRSFAGLTRPSSGVWQGIARRVMRRPVLTWALTLALMAPMALFALVDDRPYAQDVIGELPRNMPAVQALRTITDFPGGPHKKFRLGELAPLTLVLESDGNWTESKGLAVIDDISRMLAHQRGLSEVRSATQPLGSPELLERARLASRLSEVNDGFKQIAEGAKELEQGLTQGAAKLSFSMMLENRTGLNILGGRKKQQQTQDAMNSGLKQATSSLLGQKAGQDQKPDDKPAQSPGPQEAQLRELTRAAQGAREIAQGAERASHEVGNILNDPVGQRALDRLLINGETLREQPELAQSFTVYISPDGHKARFDLVQADRLFSSTALDQVEVARDRVTDYLHEEDEVSATGLVTGPNAQAYDTRVVTRRDQYITWFVVPIGVFFILLLSIRNVLSCINLVLTMVLTYSFAMGLTHLVFVTGLGADGIDWKVPYFLFVLLVAVGVDYNVFLMSRVHEEVESLGVRSGITRAVSQTGGLITSAAMITACSFASFLSSPLGSIRQLGFALVVGILIDAVLVRPILVPCGQWMITRDKKRKTRLGVSSAPAMPAELATVGR